MNSNKKFIILIATILVVIPGIFISTLRNKNTVLPTETNSIDLNAENDITTIASDLNVPWDFAFLPEGGFLITERNGSLIHIDKDGTKKSLPIQGVRSGGEGGLLGITLHPDFDDNRLLYLYLTTTVSSGTENRIEQHQFTDGALSNRKVIFSGIPGAKYHDGGRMEFGPDGLLYITTGDAGKPELAQDKNSLAGKILRISSDGSIPDDNPFGNPVYSFGHRNPQGMAWDAEGQLWSTEHGRSGVQSGFDEINLIEKGVNYGWPAIEGDEANANIRTPVLHSGAKTTWAPASLAHLDGSLFFGGLRGETLYEVILDGESIGELREHMKGELGRIRTVRVGPDGFLYLTTSNRDGRGKSEEGDDKFIRIDPRALSR